VRANGARQLSKGELIRAAEVAVVNRFVLQREYTKLQRRWRVSLAVSFAGGILVGLSFGWVLLR